jgi:hypothetical protein
MALNKSRWDHLSTANPDAARCRGMHEADIDIGKLNLHNVSWCQTRRLVHTHLCYLTLWWRFCSPDYRKRISWEHEIRVYRLRQSRSFKVTCQLIPSKETVLKYETLPDSKTLVPYLLTHSMVQDIIWKADCHSACQKISFLMEPEGSLPCSHKPATGLYPEPAESSSPHRSLPP